MKAFFLMQCMLVALRIMLCACLLVCLIWGHLFLGLPDWERRKSTLTNMAKHKQAIPFQAKPEWVKAVILRLYHETGASHRKLAAQFNRLHFARTGISVGRTWVRQLLIAHEHACLQPRLSCKNKTPSPLPKNAIWAFDASFVSVERVPQQILGGIDNGTRFNLLLAVVPVLNAWTFLGHVFLCIGKFGKPAQILSDNGPAFRARLVGQVLALFGIRQKFSEPGKPWQNGRIERFFGTLKLPLREFTLRHVAQLQSHLDQFQFWYNVVRPHQHLDERTPADAWNNLDFKCKAAQFAHWFSAWDGQLRGYVLRQ